MLSLLVLAAITAISFSLATIVFIELRSSGDVVRSEPSLYATLGITEEALFQYKRFVNERSNGVPVNPPLLDVVACEPDPSVCDLGGLSFDANEDIELLDYDVNPRIQTIYAGETTSIPLYNSSTNYDAQYGLVQLEMVPADHNYNLDILLEGVAEDGSPLTPQPYTLSEGSATTITAMGVPGYQYELSLINNSPENFLVQIYSYATNMSTLKGLPFIGRKVLRVEANHLGITRTYWVNIPVGSAGSLGGGGCGPICSD